MRRRRSGSCSRASTATHCPPRAGVRSPKRWGGTASCCRSTSRRYWPLLTLALTQAIRDGNGQALLTLADQYTDRSPDGYPTNTLTAFWAVSCLDYTDSVPADQMQSRFKEFDDASPTFGRLFVYDLAKCASWPVKSTHKAAPIHAEGAPPIVVIGTTRDPATPYAWAKALASQLDSGRLITRDGDGHTGFGKGNACVDTAVEKYLVAARSRGTSSPADP